ncbi:hypothetical protein ARMGADRAFT_1040102 [Armillaria gallica]|uniref:Uncharacterized protein n=1 Tax=Armillaria gallica TaxID=47427 RepID=A0A2H3CGA7_ARMGA|nr:hypothetical protein ARMGADRAFT_1040102 [Armillaria gallica]
MSASRVISATLANLIDCLSTWLDVMSQVMVVSSLVWCSLSILFMDILWKLNLKNHKMKLPVVVSPRQTDDTHLLRKGGRMLSTDHWTIPGDLVGRTVFKPRKDRGSFEVVWSDRSQNSPGPVNSLFGITNLKAVIYYKKYPDDWWVYRYSVASLWTLDALHVALSTHALYYYLINLFRNFAAIYYVVCFKSFLIGIACNKKDNTYMRIASWKRRLNTCGDVRVA